MGISHYKKLSAALYTVYMLESCERGSSCGIVISITIFPQLFMGFNPGKVNGGDRFAPEHRCKEAAMASSPPKVNGGDRKDIRPQFIPEPRQSMGKLHESTQGLKILSTSRNKHGRLPLQ